MPGDRVQVNTWGAVEMSNVFVVDAQGNIFLPNVGPIQVAGTKNGELTSKVKQGLSRVYARNFEVYTNLMSAKPVAVFVTGDVRGPDGFYRDLPGYTAACFKRAGCPRYNEAILITAVGSLPVRTERQFVDTLRSGRHLGRGRQLLPPMPWFNYGQMTDDDLSAVWAYLRSIPPIENRVPAPLPPIPAH